MWLPGSLTHPRGHASSKSGLSVYACDLTSIPPATHSVSLSMSFSLSGLQYLISHWEINVATSDIIDSQEFMSEEPFEKPKVCPKVKEWARQPLRPFLPTSSLLDHHLPRLSAPGSGSSPGQENPGALLGVLLQCGPSCGQCLHPGLPLRAHHAPALRVPLGQPVPGLSPQLTGSAQLCLLCQLANRA